MSLNTYGQIAFPKGSTDFVFPSSLFCKLQFILLLNKHFLSPHHERLVRRKRHQGRSSQINRTLALPSANRGTEYLGNSKEGLPTPLVEEAQCHLKAWRFQCVLPLWDHLQKYLARPAPSLVLETPLTAFLLLKRDPFIFFFFLPGVLFIANYSSQLSGNSGFFCSIYGKFRKHRKVFKKSPIFLSPQDIHCHHPYISLPKED